MKTRVGYVIRLIRAAHGALASGVDLFEVVERRIDDLDATESDFLASFSNHSYFLDASNDAAIASLRPTGCEPIRQQLVDWKDLAKRRSAYFALVGAMQRGEPTSALVNIPKRSADGSCEVRSTADERKVNPRIYKYGDWRAQARMLAFHAEFSSFAHRLEVPALVTAALVDFLRSGDRSALVVDARRIAAFVLARALSRASGARLICESADPHATKPSVICHAYDSAGAAVTSGDQSFNFDRTTAPWSGAAPTTVDEITTRYLEETSTVHAQRRGCLVQLASAVLTNDGLPRHEELGAICRNDQRTESLLRAFAEFTGVDYEALPGARGKGRFQLSRWKDASVEVLAPDTFRLNVSRTLDRDRILAAVASLVEGVREQLAERDAEPDLVRILDVARGVLVALSRDDHREAGELVLRLVGEVLAPLTVAFVDHLLPADKCNESPKCLRCLVRLLALTFFEPLVALAIGDSSMDDFTADVWHRLEELDPLSRTPLLVDVGLGYTHLFRSDSDHFTLLDKWGFGFKGGSRNQLQAGLFVGDSSTRSSARSPTARIRRTSSPGARSESGNSAAVFPSASRATSASPCRPTSTMRRCRSPLA